MIPADFTDTVLHGDCKFWLPLIPAGFAHLAVFDPPYGIDYQSNMPKKGREKILIKSDETVDEALELTQFIVKELARILVDGSAIYCFQGGGGRTPCLPMTWMMLHGMKEVKIDNVIVWDKGVGLGWRHRFSWESLIFMTTNSEGKFHTWNGDVRESNVWHYRNVIPQVDDHPTQKPIEVVERAIMDSSDRGQVVIDPTAGVLTTAKAAKRLGRHYCMVELEEKWIRRGSRDLDGVREQSALFDESKRVVGRDFCDAARERDTLFDSGCKAERDAG